MAASGKQVTENRNIVLGSRCSVRAVREVIGHFIKDRHRIVAARTPFAYFFDLPAIDKDIPLLKEIVLGWRHGSFFQVGPRLLELKPLEAGIILGIPTSGLDVVFDAKTDAGHIQKEHIVVQAAWMTRHLHAGVKATKQVLDKVICDLSVKEEEQDIEDMVRFCIFYIFTSILFARSDYTCPPELAHYLEDLDCLWNYNWATAVHCQLVHGLSRTAPKLRACQGTIIINPKSAHGRNREVTVILNGCTLLLMLWYYEHAVACKGTNIPDMFPRMLRWGGKHNKRRSTLGGVLASLSMEDVLVNLTLNTAENTWLKDIAARQNIPLHKSKRDEAGACSSTPDRNIQYESNAETHMDIAELRKVVMDLRAKLGKNSIHPKRQRNPICPKGQRNPIHPKRQRKGEKQRSVAVDGEEDRSGYCSPAVDIEAVRTCDDGEMVHMAAAENMALRGSSGSSTSRRAQLPVVTTQVVNCSYQLRNGNKRKKRNREELQEVDEDGGRSLTEGKQPMEGEEEKDKGDESASSCSLNVIIDPDLLHCSICFEKLRPPIFRCQNGHVMCSPCCKELNNKCHVCADFVGQNRSLELEQVVESIRIRCCHAQYGCQRIISYLEQDAHEEECLYSPCFCPYILCSFGGTAIELSSHFNHKHKDLTLNFCYNHPFEVELGTNQAFLSFHGEDGQLFLLLNNCNVNSGYALSMACIRPRAVMWDFEYELKVRQEKSCLQFKASPTNIRKWVGDFPTAPFLLIPLEFCPPSEKIVLEVCIWKMWSSTEKQH